MVGDYDQFYAISDWDQVEIGSWDKESGVLTRWDGNMHPEHDDIPDIFKDIKLDEFPAVELAEGQPVPDERGIVYISSCNKKAYCPITGGLLESWPRGV